MVVQGGRLGKGGGLFQQGQGVDVDVISAGGGRGDWVGLSCWLLAAGWGGLRGRGGGGGGWERGGRRWRIGGGGEGDGDGEDELRGGQVEMEMGRQAMGLVQTPCGWALRAIGEIDGGGGEVGI